MDLVLELKKEHIEILSFLSKILKTHDKKERFELFIKAKELLFEHLKKEDEQFYPKLREAAKNNPNLESTLEFLSKDMKKITEFVVYFYDKYKTVDDLYSKDFIKDFSKFYVYLKNRIEKEETTLYIEYERIIKN